MVYKLSSKKYIQMQIRHVPEEAQKAMTELEIIYERIQKCFANEEEE